MANSIYKLKEEVFPTIINKSLVGGVEFSTTINSSSNNSEHRNINWLNSRINYKFKIENLTESEADILISFYRLMKGRACSFKFKDPFDYKVRNQIISFGDGVTKEFQLIKTYKFNKSEVTRFITKPIEDTVKIYVDDVIEFAEVNYNDGRIFFSTPPKDQSIIRAEFDFYILARFDNDKQELRLNSNNLIDLENISIIEVKK